MGKRVKQSNMASRVAVFSLLCGLALSCSTIPALGSDRSDTVELSNKKYARLESFLGFSMPLWDVVQGNPLKFKPLSFLGLSNLFSFKMGAPDTIIEGVIPLASVVPNPPLPESMDPEEEKVMPQTQNNPHSEPETEPIEQTPPPAPKRGGTIIIYNTHTGETYTRTDGLDRLPGKRGGVYEAASVLAQKLEQYGSYNVVQSATIHDGDFLHAYPYAESEKTLKSLLAKQKDTVMVIDVHRDANVPRKNSVVEIKGQKYATLMFVVGTNARLKHPNWTHNYEFAKKLAKRIEADYPGMMRKVETKSGRYNQHLHENSILVEIGSCENTREEAKRSATVLAQIIKEELAQ